MCGSRERALGSALTSESGTGCVQQTVRPLNEQSWMVVQTEREIAS